MATSCRSVLMGVVRDQVFLNMLCLVYSVAFEINPSSTVSRVVVRDLNAANLILFGSILEDGAAESTWKRS